jgi:hypothetical protein
VAEILGKTDVATTFNNMLSQAFTWDLPIIWGLDGAVVVISNPLLIAEQEAARYIEMQMHHNPQFTLADCTLAQRYTLIAIRLPWV